MDFFCQRCGKTVDIDESLLRIDVGLASTDLDKLLSSKSALGGSSSSVRGSVYKPSFTSIPSSVSTPPNAIRKAPQTESPFPKNVSSSFISRPMKTTAILLKTDKPPPIMSTTPNSNSSSPTTTPPSPNTLTHSSNRSTSPRAITPPNLPHFPSQPYSQSQHTFTQPHALTKARSEFNLGNTPLNRSTDGKPDPLRSSDTLEKKGSRNTLAYSHFHSQVFDASFHVGSMSSLGLKYKRNTRKIADIFQDPNALQYPGVAGSMPANMQFFPSATNLHYSQPVPPPSAQHTVSMADALVVSKLFQMVSEQIGVDLPLCNECTKMLSTDLDEELQMMELQNTSYLYHMDLLEQNEKKWAPCSEIEEEIKKLEEEERELRGQIDSLHEQKEQVSEEVVRLKAEAQKLVNFEDRYWMNFDELHAALSGFIDERDACKVQTANTRELLKRFQRTQIINDAFHIWHDGHFGTVNSFRLGRLPSQPVDWNEINAAWGLATLLLFNMARRVGFNFSTYRLIPSGSCSKMERIDNSSTYELFGSSDISLGRLFWYRRFDNGMVAFLVCLKEMGDFAEQRDKSFRLPHKMEKDKVGDMSIKIQFNNEETWTKSLKYTLTNLKWLLAWVVRMEAEQVAAKSGNIIANIEDKEANTNNNHNPNHTNNHNYINNLNNTNNTSNTIATVNNIHSINTPPQNLTTTQPAPTQQRSRLTMLFSRSGTQ